MLSAILGCGSECDSVDDCDPDECQLIRGRNLDSEDPDILRPAGCTSNDQAGGSDVFTTALAPDQSCWLFPSSLIPKDFTRDDTCACPETGECTE